MLRLSTGQICVKQKLMIRLIVIIILVLQVFHNLQGQNLVSNGSFEELIKCLDNCENPDPPIAIAKSWFSSTLQTPDVFSPCNTTNPEDSLCLTYYAPNNWKGYQFASEGTNYAGYGVGAITIDSVAIDNFTEYMGNKLSNTLEKKKYCINLVINVPGGLHLVSNNGLPLYAYVATNKIGVLFSKDQPFESTYGVFSQTPQVWLTSDFGDYFSDSLGWERAKGYYDAGGSERYLTIGSFVPLNELDLHVFTNMTHAQINSLIINGEFNISSYQYIDDVQLIEIPELVVSNDTSMYSGSTLSLTCNTPTDGIAWFAGDTTNAIGTDSSINISPSVTTSYFLKANQCKLVTWDTVTITVLPKPIVPVNVWLSNTFTKDAFKVNYTGDFKPELDVELFNSVGQLVTRFKATDSIEVPIADLAAGVYYCRVRSGEIPIITDKILKIR
jgi:hypothetical protein